MESALKGPVLTLPSFNSLQAEFDSLVENSFIINKIALVYEDRFITFKELDYKSSLVARFLQESYEDDCILKGPQHMWRCKKIVAIYMRRSHHLVTSLVGILRSGAAYLPIGITWPKDHIKIILDEARPFCIISDHKDGVIADVAGNSLNPIEVFTLDDVDKHVQQSVQLGQTHKRYTSHSSGESDVACVLYTSGSTGKPRGVKLTNSNILNRLQWYWTTFPFAKDEVMCFKTAITFVDSMTEIFSALLQACPLVIAPEGIIQNPKSFITFLGKHRVTRLTMVPSLLHIILMYLSMDKSVRHHLVQLWLWVCSGETLMPSLVRQFYKIFRPNKTLCNFYGSTELTGDVSYELFNSKSDLLNKIISDKVSIGVPINNTTIYVLTESLHKVKQHHIGEIFVSGRNVVPGYLATENNPNFMENPYSRNESDKVLYKTGDFGCVIHGRLFFEGRYDSQVKVRGKRIDLHEIECAIHEIHGIDNVIALCHGSDAQSTAIVAFYTLRKSANLQPEQIRKSLMTKLPSFMIPNVHKILQIPLLQNGKVDRKKLLTKYVQERFSSPSPVEATSDTLDEVEKVVAHVVRDVLDIPNGVYIQQMNFFNLGGNSLNALTTVLNLTKTGIHIDIDSFLQASTIADIAKHVETVNKDKSICCGYKQTESEDYVKLKKTNSSRKTTEEFFFRIIALHESKQPAELINVLANSFSHKNPLDIAVENYPETHATMLRTHWKDIINSKLSLVAVDKNSQIIGGVVSFDLFDEPVLQLPEKLVPIFELHEELEDAFRKQMKDTNTRWLHNSLMGTSLQLTFQQNVKLVKAMEEAVLNLAESEGYHGIFTCNSNKLNQDICEHFLDFETVSQYRIKDYVYNGQRVFAKAKDDDFIKAMIKYL